MARFATRKTHLSTVDGTPKKRVFLSIISDYDLKTGICELIDNALDFWISKQSQSELCIDVTLDPDRQWIRVQDNAGGVSESDVELLVAPGASRNDTGQPLIGVFGVGGKRAGVALGEIVEIRSRFGSGKTIALDLSSDWIESPDWELDVYEVPSIAPNSTIVEISKVRQSFQHRSVDSIARHLAETYSWFIEQGCEIKLNGNEIVSKRFDVWAYPSEYPPRQTQFEIRPASLGDVNVTLTAGLIQDREPEQDNYGVYFYCNHRLITKEVRTRDVGFVSGEAGVPHPDASLCRVIIEFHGPAELMPWNSSKSAINFDDPAFTQIRPRVIDFASYYSGLSRRLKRDWTHSVFRHETGSIEIVDAQVALSNRKKILPKLPRTRSPSHIENLRQRNERRLSDRPWLTGLVESMGFVDLLTRQRYETGNRVALILLDSNFEIALKEYIVHKPDLFPPYKYTDKYLGNLFKRRTDVIKEVQPHVKFPKYLLEKVNHYYSLRNVLIHERGVCARLGGQFICRI